ncbi:NADH-quinone oxidoreductase subunit N [Methylomagnum ishizawai]|uniref:NADH-quinone oxidoreductase subunit N n=1 Tax=Methylomagnum ishizawai TaxID=1760988 RepID=UPI001C31ECAE|nr:NADH-quinone oxidoreductase subunit N [Methylomagnum ishizawai]BBL74620.1 NADH-quinone oxidoreductase subunit N [Methylomagnum ishizawai]
MIAAAELVALSPLLALAGSVVLALLAIACHRGHGLIFALTLAGMVAALGSIPFAAELAPRAVTPLLRVDGYALAFMGLAGLAGLCVAVLCRDYFANRAERPEELYVLLLTALLGAFVLAASHHFAGFFLGLETLSVSLFALIAYPCRDGRPLEAGMKYLVLSGTASGLLAFGMAWVYADTGSLEFAAFAQTADGGLLSLTGLLLIAAALGFKLSLFPFHLWTADVYQGAPVPVTALLATVAKGAVLVLLLRYTLAGGLAQEPALEQALGLMAGLSMLAGNLLALRQDNLKRLLAYSSIAHMGYLVIILMAGGRVGAEFAAEALLFYLAAYFITSLAAFGVVAVLSPQDREAEHLDAYLGLFHTRPWPASVLALALLSLAGIPLTAGFVGKFYVFASGGRGALWALLGTLVVGSGLGLYYYLRVIVQMAREPAPADGAASKVPLPWAGGVVLGFLALLLLGLGVYPGGLIGLLAAAGGSR